MCRRAVSPRAWHSLPMACSSFALFSRGRVWKRSRRTVQPVASLLRLPRPGPRKRASSRWHFWPTGGSWPKVLLVSPDEKTAYVSNWESRDVSVIDTAAPVATAPSSCPPVDRTIPRTTRRRGPLSARSPASTRRRVRSSIGPGAGTSPLGSRSPPMGEGSRSRTSSTTRSRCTTLHVTKVFSHAMYDRVSIAVDSGEGAALPDAQQNTTPSRIGAFRNAEALEERPRHRTLTQMLFRPDTRDACDEPRVGEVQSWGLGDPLAEVSIVQRQGEEQLTAAGREHPQQAMDVSRAADVMKRAHVPLEDWISSGIRGSPWRSRNDSGAFCFLPTAGDR